MSPEDNLVTVAGLLEDAPSVTNSLASTTLAMVLSSATSVATAAPTASASIYDDDENDGECSLLGSFALLVQAALGALALLALVYKRWRERPQRPVKIWAFDASKQVFGSVLLHIANIFMSMLTSGRFSVQVAPATTAARMMARSDEDYTPNPCSSYLLNLAIDTTVGIPILIVLLHITTGLVAYTPLGKPIESIQSGNYGNPPKAWWWLKQSVIYFFGLFGMKICVLIIFLMMPWISKVGDWALSWTDGNEKLQIAFVMMIFPLIMNALQYYIIDSFIKKKDNDHERLPSEDPDEGQRRRRYDDSEDAAPLRDADVESLLDSDDEEVAKQPVRTRVKDAEEYDPATDGDDRTVSGSSQNGQNEQSKLQPELYPKE